MVNDNTKNKREGQTHRKREVTVRANGTQRKNKTTPVVPPTPTHRWENQNTASPLFFTLKKGKPQHTHTLESDPVISSERLWAWAQRSPQTQQILRVLRKHLESAHIWWSSTPHTQTPSLSSSFPDRRAFLKRTSCASATFPSLLRNPTPQSTKVFQHKTGFTQQIHFHVDSGPALTEVSFHRFKQKALICLWHLKTAHAQQNDQAWAQEETTSKMLMD